MSDERYDYQRQLEEDRRRDEEERARAKNFRDSWRVWAETGRMPTQEKSNAEH